MSGIFRFKQFEVDQSGCAMKINTDGVLLGAIAGEGRPENILDIGTGTGVIALMLAQRFPEAKIDAVEIDNSASQTAGLNFENSPYAERMSVYSTPFAVFFDKHPDKKYELIASNPPFYIDSLVSPKKEKTTAKHAEKDFFNELIKNVAGHLTSKGECWLVLPLNTSALVKDIATNIGLYLHKVTGVKSFADSEPHREILVFGLKNMDLIHDDLKIYSGINNYTSQYRELLQPFFLKL